MLEALNIGIWKRGDKWRAYWKNSPEGLMEGPERDTEEEADKDLEDLVSIAKRIITARFPHAVITVNRTQ